jgi:hypothetical protein
VIPLLLLLVDTGGVLYFVTKNEYTGTSIITSELEPYRGQTVLLERSVFQFDGFFDRFGIRQKFLNPEATVFYDDYWDKQRPGRETGRFPFGGNIAFEEDVPPLPVSLDLLSDAARPWRIMSDGLVFLDTEELFSTLYNIQMAEWIVKTLPPSFEGMLGQGLWNYASRVKLYMQVLEKPKGDMILALTASPRFVEGVVSVDSALARKTEIVVSDDIRLYTFSAVPTSVDLSLPEDFFASYYLPEEMFLQEGTMLQDDEGNVKFSLTLNPVTHLNPLWASRMTVRANERLLGEWLWDESGSTEKTVLIPREILEESYNDDLHLLTLRFDLTEPGDPDKTMKYCLKFERMEVRSK